jgi:hypothetical protein
MTIVTRRRRLHRISDVNFRLSHLGSPTGHHIQMIINDEEAVQYMQQSDKLGYIDLMKFIASHAWAFKDPAVSRQAQVIVDAFKTDGPKVVLVMVEVAEQDSHDLLRALSVHQRRCPGMIVEIA